jgi:uncharacterized flavoprotein (TIGR03862 family)
MTRDAAGPETAVIGAGPGGLMAAEILATAGARVMVYERKPSPARKLLLAGIGGLNLTHSEDLDTFMTRYGAAAERLRPAITRFPPAALRAWCDALGEPTFTGTSGRVFPQSFKAAPLLRAWLAKLDALGVTFRMRRTWEGWDNDGRLVFAGPDGQETAKPDMTLLALGGASWPRLGADGGWTEILRAEGISVTPLRPANCGFTAAWSEPFRVRHAGHPVKPVTLAFGGRTQQGEMMMTEKGVEGGVIYAFSGAIREEIEKNGSATIRLDLRPGVAADDLARRFGKPRGALSFSNVLQKTGGLSSVAAALVREAGGAEAARLPPDALAALVKSLPLRLNAPFPIDRAISTAGGIALDAMDGHFMLKNRPGVFAVGEMLDWEAPTGGYLLQATFSTAVWAAERMLETTATGG